MEFLRAYESESEAESESEDVLEPLRSRDLRYVFLVTYSQADEQKIPTRRAFADTVVESFTSTSSELQVIQWCCCQETHKNGGLHYHLALKVNKYQRWMNSKRYLQDRYGINVHYSARHHNYFSAWKYVTKSDKDYIESQDHPDLNDYPGPRTDAASRARRRVRAYNSSNRASQLDEADTLDEEAESETSRPPKKKKRLTPFEVSEIIQSRTIKTVTELQALAQEQRDEGKTNLAEFLLSRSPRFVADLLKTSWDMYSAKETLARANKTRMELIEDVLQTDCTCSHPSVWRLAAEEVLINNEVDIHDFGEAVVDLLKNGRAKFKNILIVGPANCAKTFLLDPLTKIFKTFSNPASNSRFAWVGVEDAECIFLNDFRWNAEMIPWHDLLLLLEGQEVHLPAPKTHFAQDIHFNRDTPIFATSKDRLIYVKNGQVDVRETEMMNVRWKIFTFYAQIAQSQQRQIPPCQRCFAELITATI